MVRILSIDRAEEIVNDYFYLAKKQKNAAEKWDLSKEALKIFGIENFLYGAAATDVKGNFREHVFQRNSHTNKFNAWYIEDEPFEDDYLLKDGFKLFRGKTGSIRWGNEDRLEALTPKQKEYEKKCHQDFGIFNGITYYLPPGNPTGLAAIGLSATFMNDEDWSNTLLLHEKRIMKIVNHLHRQIMKGLIAEFAGLTDEHIEILWLLADGLARKEIEHLLEMSNSTLTNRLNLIASRLKCQPKESYIRTTSNRFGVVN
ncbi:hypothetical protein MTBPR1_30108 [Candidatus Terasakiella magnetica]|uniref:Transcription factor LuxR-like autoinducer-binding domain-containing protein n=1 Tax=Candidatus Terasakiella magnetica TaxID=1867952 RepID=A0A1C3RHH9_9PROT|nr:autoinducer binding domain-containing protein [Candidatus Terasakiella magnetica]SCA56738.1 hypothetical protein MTBPR1_30108 [Candidatus Terasakiella magnetica]